MTTSQGAHLTHADFMALAELVESQLGIKMPTSKRTMLQARLLKRMRILGVCSVEQYRSRLLDEASAERVHFFDVVTTNKTAFLREPDHFDALQSEILPHLERTTGAGTRRALSCWSAGCSTGEEPYTLAMVLASYTTRTPRFQFQILGTDVSTRALEKARAATYREEDVAPLPLFWRQKYLLRSKDADRRLVRIVPELRSVVQLRHLNFMHSDYQIRTRFDFIFCRNVIIYFDRIRQQEIVGRLCDHILPGGFLFVGHSETLHGLRLPLVPAGRCIYRKQDGGSP